MQPLGLVIRSHASTQPDRAAIVCTDRPPLSYARLHAQIESIGARLRQAGFGCEARIGVALPNGPEAVVLIVAISCHATVVPLNNKLAAGELPQLFERVKMDAVVLHDGACADIRKIANALGIAVMEARFDQGGEIECALSARESAAAASNAQPGLDSLALILQTSGTTGHSKLVPVTHRNLHCEAVKIRDWFNLTPDDRCLSFLPLYYAHGLREITFPP